MKKLFSKIFFPGITIKEYVTITTDKPIQEKVFLKNGKNVLDISKIHWLLCLEPMIFGVWLGKNEEGIFDGNLQSKIFFTDTNCVSGNAEKRSLAILTVQLHDKLKDENGTLLLLELKKSKIKHLSYFETYLIFLLHYKKPTISFNKFKALVATFSYPRKVCLISFRNENYYNIFPMDLLGEIKNCNRYLFGLRHSNSALEKITETKKIMVSDISFKHKNIIYQLGKHHSTKPPSITSLPFKTIFSESFNFPVPEFANSYKEVEILQSLNLGSQMLLWGKAANEVYLKSCEGNLFHIHFLLHLHQQKKITDVGYKMI